MIEIPYRIPRVPEATLSSGAKIVSGAAYDVIGSDMVDMETYSVLRVSRRFKLPMIGLRGISDGRTKLTGFQDWAEYLHVIDEKLAAAIDGFSGHVKSGQFRLQVPAQ